MLTNVVYLSKTHIFSRNLIFYANKISFFHANEISFFHANEIRVFMRMKSYVFNDIHANQISCFHANETRSKNEIHPFEIIRFKKTRFKSLKFFQNFERMKNPK